MDFSVALTLVQTLLQLLDSSSPLRREIESVWGYKNQLKKLENTISTIQNVLLDAEKQQLQLNNTQQGILKRLNEVLYEVDDLLDEVATLVQRKKFMSGNDFYKETAIGIILIVKLTDTNTLPKGAAILVVLLTCLFVMSFAWSWGPLGWLIPSETFPIETRTAGFAFAVSSNMFFTFLIAQAFLSMLCHMRAYIFIFFSGWIVVMAFFVVFLLPETKGVPIDAVAERVWKKHP